jgi:hypothetical protein
LGTKRDNRICHPDVILRLAELEKRIDLALKGLNILLLGEAEDLPAKERKILQKRFREEIFHQCRKSNNCATGQKFEEVLVR